MSLGCSPTDSHVALSTTSYEYTTAWTANLRKSQEMLLRSRERKLEVKVTRKLCYRKDDRAMRPVHGALEIFMTLYAHGYYSQPFSWAFVPIHPMNVPSKFEIRSFTRS